MAACWYIAVVYMYVSEFAASGGHPVTPAPCPAKRSWKSCIAYPTSCYSCMRAHRVRPHKQRLHSMPATACQPVTPTTCGQAQVVRGAGPQNLSCQTATPAKKVRAWGRNKALQERSHNVRVQPAPADTESTPSATTSPSFATHPLRNCAPARASLHAVLGLMLMLHHTRACLLVYFPTGTMCP
jgi:hypothetical protein